MSGVGVTFAQAIVAAAGLWLVAAGLVAAARPETALGFIGRMGSTWRIHATEHIIRGAVGAALIAAASLSRFPALFEIAGWFIVVSSVLILLAPRRWHAAYARRAARSISPDALRFLAPLSAIAGGGLVWATVSG